MEISIEDEIQIEYFNRQPRFPNLHHDEERDEFIIDVLTQTFGVGYGPFLEDLETCELQIHIHAHHLHQPPRDVSFRVVEYQGPSRREMGPGLVYGPLGS